MQTPSAPVPQRQLGTQPHNNGLSCVRTLLPLRRRIAALTHCPGLVDGCFRPATRSPTACAGSSPRQATSPQTTTTSASHKVSATQPGATPSCPIPPHAHSILSSATPSAVLQLVKSCCRKAPVHVGRCAHQCSLTLAPCHGVSHPLHVPLTPAFHPAVPRPLWRASVQCSDQLPAVRRLHRNQQWVPYAA